MPSSSLVLLFGLATCAQSLAIESRAQPGWDAAQFTNLLTFGDSYTDETRYGYYNSHRNDTPPSSGGAILPQQFHGSDGGRIWPRYVVQYTGSEVNNVFVPQMTLYGYATSGAVCDVAIINRPSFPGIIDYEIPAFIDDGTSLNLATGKPYFTPALSRGNAVYVQWIGTNDLGSGAILTDSQEPGKTLSDYTDCIFKVFDELYATGARSFVLMNNAPLDLAPLYANDTQGGVGPNNYWPNKPDNNTAISEQMREYVALSNDVFEYQLPFEVQVARRYPGSLFALYDVHQLMMDIYYNPTAYLNGSLPADVKGFETKCPAGVTTCNVTASPDSFLWYDELHPSEQTDRIIARNFIDVINGSSTYATYWS